MNKKLWLTIIIVSLFPPLLIIPLVYYFFYRPLKDGVVGGSQLRFYFWGTFILSFSLMANLPIKNITDTYSFLNSPTKINFYILADFILCLISIFLLFFSLRNDVEKNRILPLQKFKPDKLFLICLVMAFFPLFSLFFQNKISIDNVTHPLMYAIGMAFLNKSYFIVTMGFVAITFLTAILEESFFRGILLYDYGKLGPVLIKCYRLMIFILLIFKE